MRVDDLVKFLSIGQSLATILAVVVGGLWSYSLFFRRRQQYPRAVIEHHLTHRPFRDGQLLVCVDVVVRNPGDMLLSLTSGETVLSQMVPPPTELLAQLPLTQGAETAVPQYTGWKRIGAVRQQWKGRDGRLEIEPGEFEALHYDFILAAGLTTLSVYSWVPNGAKRQRRLGWSLTTVHDLTHPDSRETPSRSVAEAQKEQEE